MIKIIEQNIFNRANSFIQVLTFFLWPDQYLQLMRSPISNLEIQYKMQNQQKCYFYCLNELDQTLYTVWDRS